VGPVSEGRLAGYYQWWVPVSEIVVGDLVFDDVHNTVYRVTTRDEPEGALIFSAEADAKLSGPGAMAQDTQLIFDDTTKPFVVLKKDPPDLKHIRQVPS